MKAFLLLSKIRPQVLLFTKTFPNMSDSKKQTNPTKKMERETSEKHRAISTTLCVHLMISESSWITQQVC